MSTISTKHLKPIVKLILICLLGGAVMFSFFGCGKKEEENDVTKYKVDYCGQKDSYPNAEDAYPAGEQVELYFPFIATDTDYSFTLDDGPVKWDYEDDKGFVIRFTMPEHDVTLKCTHKNSMVYEPPTEQRDVLLLDSYRSITGTSDDGGYDEISLYSFDDSQVMLHVYHQEGDAEETEVKYLVPYEVVDRCYEIIKQHKLREWKTLKDPVSLDGTKLVLKFKDDDLYVRVTSDKMPKDGEKAFSEIEALLKSYIKDEYLFKG